MTDTFAPAYHFNSLLLHKALRIQSHNPCFIDYSKKNLKDTQSLKSDDQFCTISDLKIHKLLLMLHNLCIILHAKILFDVSYFWTFWIPSISLERVKLETANLACILITRDAMGKCKIRSKGVGNGSRDPDYSKQI